MNAFVSSSATDQLLPPWFSTGCQTWSFAVEVSPANVENYLDKYFNGRYPDRAPFAYAPLPGPQFGLITYAQHPHIISRARRQPTDRLKFNQVLWTLPVRRYRVTADALRINPETVWVQPFSFCDNASVMFASREIWGEDTVYATIENHDPPPPRDLLHVDVAIEGIRKFSPYSKSQNLGCMHITQAVGPTTELTEFLKERPDMEAFAAQVAAFRGARGDAPELDNLKQFRDAYDLRLAVYRAIVASRASHSKVEELRFYANPDDTKIDILWSDSIKEMATSLLGVQAPKQLGPPPTHTARPSDDDKGGVYWDLPQTSLEVQLAFSFKSNVRFDVLDTLFTYGADDRPSMRRATSASKS